MKIAKCISDSKTLPGEIIIGKKYWLDEDSIVEDSDGNLYVDTYIDEEKMTKIGRFLLNYFDVIYRPLVEEYKPVPLEHFVNLHIGLLLRDIIAWCKNNAGRSLSTNIMKIIHDEKLDIKENMDKDFVVNYIPYNSFKKRGMEKEYKKCNGYSLYCLD